VRSVQAARARAREIRALVGEGQDGLLPRLERYLKESHSVRINAVAKEFLDGGRGELDTSAGRTRLNYDRGLDGDPPKKLELLAHELGHLVLHPRLTRSEVPSDPLAGSAYLGEGAAGLARYNPRSREEAEAIAFATEFVCPADTVFERWRTIPGITADVIAGEWGLSADLVQVQLAEGLYRFVTGALAAEEEPPGETPTNREQECAAILKGVPVLVDAGPGTGKTKTLVRRIVHLLSEENAPPESLLVLTFSREAAEELRGRIARAVDRDPAHTEIAAGIEIATFHEFGVRLLYEHGHLLGLPEALSIMDEAVQEETVNRVLGRVDCDTILKLKDLDETASEAVRHITYLKDRLYTPERFGNEIHDDPHLRNNQAGRQASALHAVYGAYEEEKAAAEAVDFADLILLPIRLLEGNAELREALRQRYRWVMVDEYQDVSRSVAGLLQQLCGPDNPPWVVGDARQAIYRFRGAAPENVECFAEDFPGAMVRRLHRNYRSSEAIVKAANHLATLMVDQPPDGGAIPETWRSAVELAAINGEPVTMVEADSDRAEHEGVVELVRAWMETDKAKPGELAVLARRNIDVRNIALALNRAEIPAVTTGLITAEGAAGDLAAAVSLLDARRGALPRLLFRLGDRTIPIDVRNAAVRYVLATIDDKGVLPDPAIPGAEALLAELRTVADDLEPLRFSGDGWDVLCAFLFGRSAYLRELLGRADAADAALALEEILTSLGLAATHRFTHLGMRRGRSRRAFAQRFRRSLTEPTPGTIAPRARVNAVRVMTCHASKGLEFPFVVVAGQSLPIRKRDYTWLPAALRPPPNDDALQADALLFVGVTRAQRAVAVSFARTASGSGKARPRPLPRLLSRWRDAGGLPVRCYESGPTIKETVRMSAIWGGAPPASPSSYSLVANCTIRAYLQDHLDVNFPSAEIEIYPKFVDRLRRTLQHIVRLAHERAAPLDADEAEKLLDEYWPENDFKGHPHLTVFLPRARNWVRAFAAEYDPREFQGEALEPAVVIGVGNEVRTVRGDLVANIRGPEGRLAVLFRPDALQPDATGQALNWGTLKEYHRLPFVLLWGEDRHLRPRVFCGPSERIYDYKWARGKADEALRDELAAAGASAQAQAAGEFVQQVSEFLCDDCVCRVSCPFWIGALDDDG
jgi:superfamily I DNA/RNA helicase